MPRAASRRRVAKHKQHYRTSPEEQAAIIKLYVGGPHQAPLSSNEIHKHLAPLGIDLTARAVLYILKRNGVPRRQVQHFVKTLTKRTGRKGVLGPAKPRGRFAFALTPAVEL